MRKLQRGSTLPALPWRQPLLASGLRPTWRAPSGRLRATSMPLLSLARSCTSLVATAVGPLHPLWNMCSVSCQMTMQAFLIVNWCGDMHVTIVLLLCRSVSMSNRASANKSEHLHLKFCVRQFLLKALIRVIIHRREVSGGHVDTAPGLADVAGGDA